MRLELASVIKSEQTNDSTQRHLPQSHDMLLRAKTQQPKGPTTTLQARERGLPRLASADADTSLYVAMYTGEPKAARPSSDISSDSRRSTCMPAFVQISLGSLETFEVSTKRHVPIGAPRPVGPATHIRKGIPALHRGVRIESRDDGFATPT